MLVRLEGESREAYAEAKGAAVVAVEGDALARVGRAPAEETRIDTVLN